MVLRGVVVADGEGHDVFEIDIALAVGLENERADIGEFQSPCDNGFGNAEPCGDVGCGQALIGEIAESLELVGRVHRLAHDVFGEADFRCIGCAVDDMARNGHVGFDPAVCGEDSKSHQASSAGDDRVFAARLLAHDERLQKPVGCDGSGEFVDSRIARGFPDFPSQAVSLFRAIEVVSVIGLSFARFFPNAKKIAGSLRRAVTARGTANTGAKRTERAGR